MWLPMVIASAGLVALWFGWRAWLLARLVEDTPTSLTRSAAQGFVRLDGEARLMPGEPVTAPLSGRHCVWWRFRIEERDRRDRWRTVDQATSEAIFELADATGVVLVDPDGADVHGAVVDVWFGDTARPSAGPPVLPGFRGLGDRYRYREERIEPGSFLHALGHLGTERAATGSAHDAEIAARLRAWKRDPIRLADFDRNRDGQLDLGEWEQARAAARRESIHEAAAAASTPTSLLRAPAHGRPYLLGALPPAELAARHRWQARAGGLIFLVASVVAARLATTPP